MIKDLVALVKSSKEIRSLLSIIFVLFLLWLPILFLIYVPQFRSVPDGIKQIGEGVFQDQVETPKDTQ